MASSSVCVEAGTGCFAPTTVRVNLSGGDDVILGAQFSLEYDNTALALVSISPGRNCDLQSPFSLELFSNESTAQGTVFYAVGVNPVEYGSMGGTRGPAALACVTFRAIHNGSSEVCLFDQGSPFKATLVNDAGSAVQIDNSGTCPGAAAPKFSCTTASVSDSCTCTIGTDDCAGLNEPCIAGVCNPTTGHCDLMFSNEGLPCDDGLSCTSNDVCQEGRCTGTGCRNPSLCISSDSDCKRPHPGDIVTLAIHLGAGDLVITGGQFSIEYDPAVYGFVDISPGASCNFGSPFSVEVFESVDPSAGTIFYATSIPFGGTGTQGPATMACIQLRVLAQSNESICLFSAVNPRTTALVDDHGRRVFAFNGIDCPGDFAPPILACTPTCRIIPASGSWGLVVMALVLLIAAKVGFSVLRPPAARKS
ncbi:MAG: hypothetical protein HY287_01100 [Planctomycetes bacterium]|nr:hypothetical protein [Planctomycetota bacterium]MBI3832905.1 hypothetical protein [Planctomycetota bacterium]